MTETHRSPWIAGILSLFMLGIGHIYVGQAKKGIQLYLFSKIITLAFLIFFFYFKIIGMVVTLLMALGLWGFAIADAVRCAKKAGNAYLLKWYNRWYYYFLCYFLFFIILGIAEENITEKYFIRRFALPSGSSAPTLLIGDRIIAKMSLSLRSGIKRGDMIVFLSPKKPESLFIKRVVAIGGDTIEMKNKKVWINNKEIKEPYATYKAPIVIPDSDFGPIKIPDDSVFVLGDNRDYSADSRIFGPVKLSSIKGRPHRIYWSRDRETKEIRWDRIGQLVH